MTLADALTDHTIDLARKTLRPFLAYRVVTPANDLSPRATLHGAHTYAGTLDALAARAPGGSFGDLLSFHAHPTSPEASDNPHGR